MGRCNLDIIVNGIGFDGRASACKHFGVKYNSVYEKERREGISTEEAINKLLKSSTRKRINLKIDGIEFKSIKALAKHLKVNEKTLSKYIKIYKDCNRAIDELQRRVLDIKQIREEKYKLFGKVFKDKREISEYFDISYNTLNKSNNLEKTISSIIYKRDIINHIEDIYIIKIDSNNYFILDTELDKVLLYKDYSKEFLAERKLE